MKNQDDKLRINIGFAFISIKERQNINHKFSYRMADGEFFYEEVNEIHSIVNREVIKNCEMDFGDDSGRHEWFMM